MSSSSSHITINTDSSIGAIESVRWLQHEAFPLQITGWVLMRDVPHALCKTLSALVGEDRLGSYQPVLRPDVADAFLESPNAIAAGFDLRIPAIAPTALLIIEVESESGVRTEVARFPAKDISDRQPFHGNYPLWSAMHHRLGKTTRSESVYRDHKFSVIVPVFDPPRESFLACLESMRKQTHPHWELLVVDDGSTKSDIVQILQQLPQTDARIKVTIQPENRGISKTLNTALQQAGYDWLVFLDHDDVLLPDALAEMAAHLAQHPETEVAYTDEEKITAESQSWEPFLKPGFSPIFLRGVMYPGHLLTVKRKLALSIGGFDPVFDGIQDYEFALRLSEVSDQFRHLPEILYQWRMIPASSATSGNIKGDMDTRQAQSVDAHLRRLNIPGHATAISGHRVLLEPTSEFHPPSYSLHAYSDPQASAEVADYHVVYSQFATAPSNEQINAMLFLATLAPSHVIAPTLHSSDNWVAESGSTIASNGDIIPIMRGFAPEVDGYNGSLCCHREVLTTSGHVAVISTNLWQRISSKIGKTFDPAAFSQTLVELKIPVVVDAATKCSLSIKLNEIPRAHSVNWSGAPPSDPYWNPSFDADTADYGLTPLGNPQLHFHLDSPAPHRSVDGRIALSGWAFVKDSDSSAFRVKIGDWKIPIQYGESRPDVIASNPNFTHDTCGFSAKFQLPPGSHQVDIQLRPTATAEWLTLFGQQVEVTGGTPSHPIPPSLIDSALLAFQFGIHPKHPPRPIAFPPLQVRSAPSNWPQLSIVTPNFNQGRFLVDVVESVRSSHSTGIKHFVQDGGSSDESVAQLRQLESPQLSWTSEADDGQADAINRGFAQCSEGADSDIMAWINADDLYAPHALDWVRDYFATHPEVDLIYGNRIVINETGREINRWTLPGHDSEVLKLNDFVPQETMFWRRKLWSELGGLNSRLQFALDWDFLLRAQESGARIEHVPQFLGCFRVHPQQKTSAQIESVGQREIDSLRERTFERKIDPIEIAASSILRKFLRESYELEHPNIVNWDLS